MSAWWSKNKNLMDINGPACLQLCCSLPVHGWYLRILRIPPSLPKVLCGLRGEKREGAWWTQRHLASQRLRRRGAVTALAAFTPRLPLVRPFSTFPFIKQETQMLVIRSPSPAAKSHSVPKSPVYSYLCVNNVPTTGLQLEPICWVSQKALPIGLVNLESSLLWISDRKPCSGRPPVPEWVTGAGGPWVPVIMSAHNKR